MAVKYHDDDLLTDKEVAEYLGISPGTPAVWRAERRYPFPFVRIGRSVRTQFGDIKKALNASKFSGNAKLNPSSTCEPVWMAEQTTPDSAD